MEARYNGYAASPCRIDLCAKLLVIGILAGCLRVSKAQQTVISNDGFRKILISRFWSGALNELLFPLFMRDVPLCGGDQSHDSESDNNPIV